MLAPLVGVVHGVLGEVVYQEIPVLGGHGRLGGRCPVAPDGTGVIKIEVVGRYVAAQQCLQLEARQRLVSQVGIAEGAEKRAVARDARGDGHRVFAQRPVLGRVGRNLLADGQRAVGIARAEERVHDVQVRNRVGREVGVVVEVLLLVVRRLQASPHRELLRWPGVYLQRAAVALQAIVDDDALLVEVVGRQVVTALVRAARKCHVIAAQLAPAKHFLLPVGVRQTGLIV